MADETGISWADSTFNPWIGCDKVSPGCAHCYAEALVTGRMGRPDAWGPDGVRRVAAESTWKKPLAWQREAEAAGKRRRVFCASLADVFELRRELEDPRGRLFDLIERTPDLDWLVLTKRPEIALVDLTWRYYDGEWAMPRNLWLGTSIENARFTWRAAVLRKIPAAIRFLSCEPLLGSLFPTEPDTPAMGSSPLAGGQDSAEGSAEAYGRAPLDLTGIDWVIVGGESGGPAARPMHPAWAREIRDAVLAVQHELDDGLGDAMRYGPRPALHMKQWGSWSPDPYGYCDRAVLLGYDGRSVRDRMTLDAYPDLLVEPIVRMGYRGAAPTAGGKHLDNTDWCEIPEPGLAPVA